MLERIEANGCKTILVETASRFARDLMMTSVPWRGTLLPFFAKHDEASN